MLNTSEKTFLSDHENFDLAPYLVIGIVIPIGDPNELSQAFFSRRPESFPCLNQACPSLTSIQDDAYDQRFLELEFGSEADSAPPYPF